MTYSITKTWNQIVADRSYLDVDRRPDGSLCADCLPRTDRCGDYFPVYEGEFDIIPRAQWDDLIEQQNWLDDMVAKIKNQKSEGTCAANATNGGFETIWNNTLGLENWIEFSPIATYRWIAPGPDTGSVIGDNLRQIMTVGTLPVDSPESRAALTQMGLNPNHVLQATGYYQTFPEGWKDTAAHFRVAEAWDTASFDGLVTAILRRFPVIYGRAGHAICGVRVVKRNGVYTIKYANSWGVWGDKGFGYDSESYISRAISSYGAFAIRAIKMTDSVLKLLSMAA